MGKFEVVKNNQKRIIFFSLSILLTAFLIILPFLIYHYDWFAGVSENELSKSLFLEVFKLIFIVLIGGVVLQEYNRTRQKKTEKKAYRNEILKMVVNTYMDLKRIRWTLRTNCKNDMIPTSTYRRAMYRLIDVKSKLEFIDSEIANDDKSFRVIKTSLIFNLGKMESYLRRILLNFEDGPSEADKVEAVDISKLPCLCNFIRRGNEVEGIKEDSDFTKNYRIYFRGAVDILR